MVSVFVKLKVLLWKCLILRMKNWLLTSCELIFPLLVTYLIYLMLYTVSMFNPEMDSYWTNHEFEYNLGYIKPPKNDEIQTCTTSTPCHIVYTPGHGFANKIVEGIIRMNKSSFTSFKMVKDEKKLEAILKNKSLEQYSVGLVFLKPKSNKKHSYRYKIRLRGENMLPTKQLYDFSTFITKDYHLMYDTFLKLQTNVDTQILKSIGYSFNKSIFIGRFPTFSVSNIRTALTIILGFLFTLTYVVLVVAVVRDVVQEKASGIKEMLRIMGAPTWSIWTHWFIYNMIVQLPITFEITIVLTMLSPQVIEASFFIVWLLIFLFTVDCVFLLLSVSCFFNRAVMGTIVCASVWIIFHIVIQILCINPGNLETYQQYLFSLVPLQNLLWSLRTLTSFKERDIEWGFRHFFSVGYGTTNISIGMSVIIFLSQSVFFCILLGYLDSIKPGPYGIAKPINFFCTWSNFNFRKIRRDSDSSSDESVTQQNNFEAPPKGSKKGIEIKNLRKTYGFFDKTIAVDNVNLDIYVGEITVLLGHNGAGKTTTLSMITGMFSATKGSIVTNGENIKHNLSNFRQSLGLCTQHNMFFPKLTVLEHLLFFGMLKGKSYTQAKIEGRRLLKFLKLDRKRNERGSSLSGGMLRRLCLAVALTGNPKILILDEPTSGLDPENRRQIWNIILSLRGERTILITTHFMEEADVLGDRIVIMDHGKVVCCGTAMFLKKQYGAGYHIHVQKRADCARKSIDRLFQQIAPETIIKEVSQTQVDYYIKSQYVEKFPNLFESLDENKTNLGIVAVSLTSTTLEDVFLQAAKEVSKGGEETIPDLKSISENLQRTIRPEGRKLFFQLLKALLLKRIYYLRRNWISLMMKIITTSLLVFVAVDLLRFSKTEVGILPISLSLYPNSINPIANNSSKIPEVVNIATRIISEQKGQAVLIDNVNTDKNMIDYLKTVAEKKTNIFKLKTLLALTLTNDSYSIRYQNLPSIHLAPIAANVMSNILLREFSNKSGGINVTSHPLKSLTSSECGDPPEPLFVSVMWVFIFGLIFMVVMADFLVFTTEDRVCGFKNQQIIAGVPVFVYWVVNFVFDVFLYLFIVFIWIIIFIAVGNSADFFNWGTIGLLFLVLTLFGASCLLFIYLITIFLNNHALSTVFLVIFNIIGGILPALIVVWAPIEAFFILFTILFFLNPLFCGEVCLFNLGLKFATDSICSCKDLQGDCSMYKKYFNNENILAFPKTPEGTNVESSIRTGILLHLLSMALCCILYPLIILLKDWKIFSRKGSGWEEDEPWIRSIDVMNEFKTVERLLKQNEETPLIVSRLIKSYFFDGSERKVVDNLTFLVSPGECFGLLGVNGAGKTTAFKILIGDIFPDSGEVFVSGYSLESQRRNCMMQVGYCPQFDSFLLDLTGEETLKIMANLRGVPSEKVREVVFSWLTLLGITEYAKRKAFTYSGGTKRKLSTAMAFIGDPKVVLLDEPTTGVDPVSRRKLWSVVQARQGMGQAIVLSSHSMEECEALCTRLTIMRRGEMQCIGTPEHLKTVFSQGYLLFIKLAEHTKEQIYDFKSELLQIFPNSVITDENKTRISFHLFDPQVTLNQIFSSMLRLKREHKVVEDFNVSNTTLEQLFLMIARADSQFQ